MIVWAVQTSVTLVNLPLQKVIPHKLFVFVDNVYSMVVMVVMVVMDVTPCGCFRRVHRLSNVPKHISVIKIKLSETFLRIPTFLMSAGRQVCKLLR